MRQQRHVWWVLSLELTWVSRNPKLLHGDAVNTLYGLFKSVRADAAVQVAYHARQGSLWSRPLTPGGDVGLELVLGGAPEAAIHAWCQAFRQLLANGHTGFQLDHLGEPTLCEVDVRLNPPPPKGGAIAGLCLEEEICLEFITPLPFNPAVGAGRTQISGAELQRLLNTRLKAWFSAAAQLDEAPNLVVNSAFWHFDSSKRRSKSEEKNARDTGSNTLGWQQVNGCRGLLFLRGVPTQWLAGLAALGHIHATGRPQAISGLGQFKRIAPAPAVLDAKLGDVDALTEIAEEWMRINDSDPIIDPQTGRVWLPREVAQHLARLLSEGDYTSGAATRFTIAKDGGGQRIVERLDRMDLVAQRHLLLLVGPVIDAVLSPASFAYRKNHSRETALQAIRAAMVSGHRYAVRADIEDFFPSVRHDRLFARLDAILPVADVLTRALLQRMVALPWRDGPQGEVAARAGLGLAQGAPLSPALANLYLNDFDHALLSSGLAFVRYGDDFVVLARSEQQAAQALDLVRRILAPEGMQLAAHKTAVHRIADGFEFLGERIDAHAGADPIESLMSQRKPVILMEPYTTLGVNGDALDIRRNGRLQATIPLRRVSELVTLSPTSLSTALIERCARFKIPVAIALPSGYQMVSLAPDSREHFRVAHAQATRLAALSSTEWVAIAGEFVAAKLDNYAAWIRGNYQAGDGELIALLEERKRLVHQAGDLHAMRGHEGWAARNCFAWLRQRVRADQQDAFKAVRRERGAPDRLNSMLNFGYYLLFIRINGLLRAHGLNPYLGILHDAKDDYETLVADVQEVFRVHVDRTVLRLINRREVTSADFGDEEGRYRLSREGAYKVATAFENTMGTNVGGALLRDVMLAQVRALKAWCIEGQPLWLHRWRDPSARGAGAAGIDVDADDELDDELEVDENEVDEASNSVAQS